MRHWSAKRTHEQRANLAGVRVSTGLAKYVVVNMDAARCWVVGFVLNRLDIADNGDIERVIVPEIVPEHLYVRIRHNQHTGSTRHQPDDVTLGGEIVGVVAVNRVVEHPNMMSALLWKVGKVENQNAACVVGQDVVVNVGVEAVFDLQPCHVVFSAVVARDDLVALADVNTCI